LRDFSSSYPESDYAGIAEILRLGAEGEVGHWSDLAIDSRKLLRSPTADNPALLVAGYSYLADARFHMKEEDEALVFAKIGEVNWTVRCGREAIQQLKTSSSSQEAQSVASSAEFTFAVAQAQASLMANERTHDASALASALRESGAALRTKPANPSPNFWYALAILQGDSPDFQGGIFYLARASSLSPDEEALKTSVGEMYKAYHGSNKELDKLLQVAGASASPPPGFWIEPQHPKNHTAAKTAAALVIAALLGYAVVKFPETFAAIGQAVVPPTQTVSLIFGGEDHKTYLGCLSCPKSAGDSVLTPGGVHGPPNEGIWDKAGFGSRGSQYIACSVYASDPPVIVDEDGTYLGRLSLNRNHSQIGIGLRYYDWLHDTVCN
jgi:hypothetical protein